MDEKDVKILVKDKQIEQHGTLAILDVLRKSRKSRGGVGAPLVVASHLNDTRQTIILTD